MERETWVQVSNPHAGIAWTPEDDARYTARLRVRDAASFLAKCSEFYAAQTLKFWRDKFGDTYADQVAAETARG